MRSYYLQTPVKDRDISQLRVGDAVFISGRLFVARDMAHLKLKQLFDNHQELGEDFSGAAIFHAGPIVKQNVDTKTYDLKSIGPTTSIRMEGYSDFIGGLGIKAIIGKGGMGPLTSAAMKKHTMAYLLAAHGCAAVHTAKFVSIIKEYWLAELGMPEALWVMECSNFGPLIVGIDATGRNLFEETQKYSRMIIDQKYSRVDRPA